MRAFTTRMVGTALIFAAIAGMIISFLALVEVWRVKPVVTNSIQSNLTLMKNTLDTTDQGLILLGDTVDKVSTNMNSLETSSQTLANTLENARPVISSADDLVNTTLPETITSTQASLRSAQSSAALMDNVIGALSRIPLLGLNRYTPDIPLSTSLGQVSKSLDTLRPSLQSMHKSMNTADQNLTTLKDQVTIIGGDLQAINSNIGQAKTVVQQYQDIVQTYQEKAAFTQAHINGWINNVAWLLTIILVWLAVTQVGLLLQGYEILSGRKFQQWNKEP